MSTSAKYTITQIDEPLQSIVQPLVDHAWGGPYIAVNSKLWDTRTMPGLAALDEGGKVIGYLLYTFHDGEYEIMVLKSLRENIGVGTRLIDRVKTIAKEHGIQKVIVMTTNDNIHALRFYQKRGFALRTLRANILETSRKLKPKIPLVSDDGICLRDEIELEIEL